jgi:hypothetical protein
MEPERPIRIVVVNGSVRPGNYTAMASALVADELPKHPKVAVEAVDAGACNLPLPGLDPANDAGRRLRELVASALRPAPSAPFLCPWPSPSPTSSAYWIVTAAASIPRPRLASAAPGPSCSATWSSLCELRIDGLPISPALVESSWIADTMLSQP